MKASRKPGPKKPFPTFASQAEAEAYSTKVGDSYFEICYHLEGQLNLCIQSLCDLYANSPPNKRAKMQTGVVRNMICPEGLHPQPETLVAMLVSFMRFRHEETCHAYTVNDAMTAFELEKKSEGTFSDILFDRRTLEPTTPAGAENARRDLLRLCDWIECRLHHGIHSRWYGCPDAFSDDPEKVHLANIGFAQRHLAKFSERDRKRWAGINDRAAAKHEGNLKMWGTVGKVQHDPQPRTCTHPDVDARIICLWPLVARYNWAYADLIKVLDRLLPIQSGGDERRYPLDSVESLRVHCRTICGLTKTGKGKSADGLPAGWEVAEQLFPSSQSKQ